MMGMEKGDVLGHEPMGILVEVGSSVTKLKKGDRVVVPFVIACGHCFFCTKQLYSCCDTTNPDAEKASKLMGHAPAGLFGYSHLLGGYAGGQAEYLRVPHADVGPIKIESDLSDEKVLFLSDIFPTGYMAAENAEIQSRDTVAVWGCGPVAQMAIQSCWMLGAGRVIAIDRVPERLEMARSRGKAETINFEEEDLYERLNAMTEGRGPDRCIDAVGCEAHGTGGGRRRSGQCEGYRKARNRSGARHPASDFLLSQRRYGLSAWRLRGADRQNAVRSRGKQGPDN
jgi:threonine dehydrogenase-like Zn-dependent dehydrogenase